MVLVYGNGQEVIRPYGVGQLMALLECANAFSGVGHYCSFEKGKKNDKNAPAREQSLCRSASVLQIFITLLAAQCK